MSEPSRSDVAVIGGGPAGLMAADVLSAAGAHVTVYERMPSLGRKFLMAGRGGLNLTHSEPLDAFLTRFGTEADNLRGPIDALPPDAIRVWCETLGQPTFVGTSGRVFPKAMKTSPLLRAWLKHLGARGVEVRLRHRWLGYTSGGELTFETPEGQRARKHDAVVLALGGASWPGLGGDGKWASILEAAGVAITPLTPSNCGVTVEWSEIFCARHAGAPLKRIAITLADTRVRGEAILTAAGMEGGGIYALSPLLRDALAHDGRATITIDLRPDVDIAALTTALAAPRKKQTLTNFLRKAAQLSPAAIGLLQESAHASGSSLASMSPEALANLAKAVPVVVTGTAGMARAISTAGGVEWQALDANMMLTAHPGTFVAGEMIDWDAPTGGYLLQACFSTGAAAGRGALTWLAERPS